MKQLEYTEKEVGGYRFSIRPFPAFKAANISGALMSTLSPLAGALAPMVSVFVKAKGNKDGKGGNDGSIMDMEVGDAAQALSNLSGIDGDRMESLMKKLLLGDNISVRYKDEDGKERTDRLSEDLANELFCGNVQDMFVLCVHVIQINYSGFFERLAALSGTEESEETQRQIL